MAEKKPKAEEAGAATGEAVEDTVKQTDSKDEVAEKKSQEDVAAKPLSERRKLLKMPILARAEFESKRNTKYLTAGAARLHGGSVVYIDQRPHEVGALTGVTIKEIVCGSDHVMAHDSTGKLWSWGRGEFGQLGHDKCTHSATPKTISSLEGFKVKDFGCGSGHTAVLMEGGELYTWGDNSSGQLGHGDCKKLSTPRPLGSMDRRHVHQMACGASHMIVLTTARDVFTWGNNRFGQLGHGQGFKNSLIPKQLRVMSGLDIKQLAAGDNHTCVLTSFGDIYTWGRGDYGQLGHGELQSKEVPTLLHAFDAKTQASYLSVGADFIIASTYSGLVYSWGRNCFGQLGHGVVAKGSSRFNRQPEDYPSPKLLEFFSGRGKDDPIVLSSIVCGSHHVLAISDRKDTLYAWGRNEHSQLGLDPRDKSMKPIPQVVTRLKGMFVQKATCGENHSMVLVEDQSRQPKVLAWGRGSFGQLGHGSGKLSVPDEVKTEIHDFIHQYEQSRPSTSMSVKSRLSMSTSRSGDEIATDSGSQVDKSSRRLGRPASCEPRLTSMFTHAEKSQDRPATKQGSRPSTSMTNRSLNESLNSFSDRFIFSHKTKPAYKKHNADPDALSMGDLLKLVDQKMGEDNELSRFLDGP